MSHYLPYYLAFSHCLGIGPVRFAQLINHFGDIEKAYRAQEKELREVLGPQTTSGFISFRRGFDPKTVLTSLAQKNIIVITREDAHYPAQLTAISDPPICLYVKGSVDALSRGLEHYFAIVGTRRATSYGLQIAKRFAHDLATCGFTIVSGLALGIDSAAHWGTIEAKHETIAVLGCGVDIIYPPTNKILYEKIIATGGAIISEFPPGHRVARGLFVARNRIISGLSRGVLVVEGSADSGALITARNAGEQGRDVFAPPSPITSTLSHAPNILLKQGAKMVTSVSDIIDEYNVTYVTNDRLNPADAFTGIEKNIIEKIIAEPQNADELKIVLQQPIDTILNHLTLLEINGIIYKNNEGKYMYNR